MFVNKTLVHQRLSISNIFYLINIWSVNVSLIIRLQKYIGNIFQTEEIVHLKHSLFNTQCFFMELETNQKWWN